MKVSTLYNAVNDCITILTVDGQNTKRQTREILQGLKASIPTLDDTDFVIRSGKKWINKENPNKSTWQWNFSRTGGKALMDTIKLKCIVDKDIDKRDWSVELCGEFSEKDLFAVIGTIHHLGGTLNE